MTGPGESKLENRLKSAAGAGNGSFDRVLKNAMTKHAPETRQEKKLWDTCIEMESLFVGKMLKEMRNSVPKNEWLHGGFAEDIFQDMLYDEYAMKLSKNSKLGIGSLLYDELSKKIFDTEHKAE